MLIGIAASLTFGATMSYLFFFQLLPGYGLGEALGKSLAAAMIIAFAFLFGALCIKGDNN